ncbi:MAG: hypothetical protein V2A76_06170 [Planctomycetota bacterium]
MSTKIRRIEYYHTTVTDEPGKAYDLLSKLSFAGVSLLAFSAIPVGPKQTQLVLFPDDPAMLLRFAEEVAIELTGPQPVFLIQGDDELGALVKIHQDLSEANVNVYRSGGVTDGKGGYGYLVYVRQADFERAARVLGV